MDVGGDISGNRIYLSFVRNVFVFTLKPSERMSLLDNINSPSDLKKLPVERLPELCEELRRFIIRELASQPGTSRVEPRGYRADRSHPLCLRHSRRQVGVGRRTSGLCPHKILTGRRDRFATNRKLGGQAGSRNVPRANTTRSEAGTRRYPYRRHWAWTLLF